MDEVAGQVRYGPRAATDADLPIDAGGDDFDCVSSCSTPLGDIDFDTSASGSSGSGELPTSALSSALVVDLSIGATIVDARDEIEYVSYVHKRQQVCGLRVPAAHEESKLCQASMCKKPGSLYCQRWRCKDCCAKDVDAEYCPRHGSSVMRPSGKEPRHGHADGAVKSKGKRGKTSEAKYWQRKRHVKH